METPSPQQPGLTDEELEFKALIGSEDDDEFFDNAMIGASYLAEEVCEFTKWSKLMERELGLEDIPLLLRLYEASAKIFTRMVERESASEQPPGE